MKKRELLEAIQYASPEADIIIGFTMSKEELEKYPGLSLDAEGNVVYTIERHIGEVDSGVNTIYVDLGEAFNIKTE